MSSITWPSALDTDLQMTLENNPYLVDLFSLMRSMEATHEDLPPWGLAKKCDDEVMQFGQEPTAIFASSTIARFNQFKTNRKPKLSIYGFGLFGPNGAMPLVFTEYAKERMTHHGDHSIVEFLDIFHNRLIMLLYRAWADAQSCAAMDRKEEKFSYYVNSLLAAGCSVGQLKDSIPSHARLHYAGHLLRHARSANGLKCILQSFFNVPVAIEEFIAQWIHLPSEEQTRLGCEKGTQLGIDTVLGSKVMGKQQYFRVHLGPLNHNEYNEFLPRTLKLRQLSDWVNAYIGPEFNWDLMLTLDLRSASGICLGDQKHLGMNSLLGIKNQSLSSFTKTTFKPVAYCG